MRIIGAGLGRTGTNSLKLALERLLGRPTYHMIEVQRHLDHVPTWRAALRGEPVDWEPVLGNYAATVDWPGAAVWRELVAENPEAVVLLSTRRDAATWLASARATVMDSSDRLEDEPDMPGYMAMVREMYEMFDPLWRDDGAAMTAYERHAASVRREVRADRLVEWQPGDGWGPLCVALGAAVPPEPFPHVNSTEEYRARLSQIESRLAASRDTIHE